MPYTSLLCSLCTISSLTTTINGMGQVSESYSAGTQVKCRLDPYTGDNETELGARRAPRPRWRLFLDGGVSIDASSRVTSESVDYNVTLVRDFFGHHIEADMERVI